MLEPKYKIRDRVYIARVEMTDPPVCETCNQYNHNIEREKYRAVAAPRTIKRIMTSESKSNTSIEYITEEETWTYSEESLLATEEEAKQKAQEMFEENKAINEKLNTDEAHRN